MASQTLERGLDCLLAIANSQTPLTIEEIASATGLPVSSVYRLVRPLEKRGLIQRMDEGKRGLGLRVLNISGTARNYYGHDIIDAASPVMNEMAEQTQETIMLTTLWGLDSICVEVIPSPQAIRISPQRGSLQTMCSGCWSKVLLAFSPKDLQEKIIKNSVGHRRFNGVVVTSELLRAELEKIHQDGYVVSFEEVDEGAAGVAAPVFLKDGSILAGLSIIGPKYRFEKEQLAAYIQIVVTAARQITERYKVMRG